VRVQKNFGLIAVYIFLFSFFVVCLFTHIEVNVMTVRVSQCMRESITFQQIPFISCSVRKSPVSSIELMILNASNVLTSSIVTVTDIHYLIVKFRISSAVF